MVLAETLAKRCSPAGSEHAMSFHDLQRVGRRGGVVCLKLLDACLGVWMLRGLCWNGAGWCRSGSWPARRGLTSCSRTNSQGDLSPSPTLACSTWTASAPSSTHRRCSYCAHHLHITRFFLPDASRRGEYTGCFYQDVDHRTSLRQDRWDECQTGRISCLAFIYVYAL